MSSSANFHNVTGVEATVVRGCGVLKFRDAGLNDVNIFLPPEAAQMMAAAWEQYRDFVAPRVDEEEDEPEPLDAETVAQRQSYTEINIIAAGRGELL